MSHAAAAGSQGPITIYPARKIITMDASLPEASAVAVCGDRIVAVGDLDSMAPWCEGREVRVDKRLEDKVLLPGLIDNHVHPWLGALLLPTAIIAPEDWRMADGTVARAALDREAWFERIKEAVASHHGTGELLASWGFDHGYHGRRPRRSELDAISPQRPLIVWHRSFHEIFANTRALEFAGLTREAAQHPQINWDEGHFFEIGTKTLLAKLMPHFLRKEWFYSGLARMAQLMHRGGITTTGDMAFGSLDIDYEIAAWDAVVEQKGLPVRVYNIPHAGALGFRLSGRKPSPVENPGFDQVLELVEQLPTRDSRRMKTLRAIKLYADGAMFSQLMQMNAPGYIDGHHGEWMMAPAVLADGVRTFWDAGYGIHVHVNGDAGVDAVLAALAAAQERRPRFDHRFAMHHVGYCSSEQTRRMAALGAVASVNPYYVHALADSYSVLGLGPERAAQIVRAGSMVRAGVPVSLHSDFMMAPIEPLVLAWCAANRLTRSGGVVSPSECLTLEQALRGITIDAAHALRMDHEIGSIVAGKKADFTVLEQDPYAVGAKGLKDITVWGTVFEGEVFPVAAPSASLHRGAHVPRRTAQSYRSVARGCCPGAQDRCDTVHRLASWASESLHVGEPASAPRR